MDRRGLLRLRSLHVTLLFAAAACGTRSPLLVGRDAEPEAGAEGGVDGGLDAPTTCRSDLDCDDGLVCNGRERCDVVARTCQSGVPLLCADDDPCTTERCVEPVGCTFEPIAGCCVPRAPDERTCADGLDDDCDGLLDCDDPACRRDASCASECVARNIAGFGMRIASGLTRGQPDFTTGSCARSAGAGEVHLHWTPPGPGRYRIDTSGSDFDTVLYLLTAPCVGMELSDACNDDVRPGGTSALEYESRDGRPIGIVVDGNGVEGFFVLNIARVPALPDGGVDAGTDAAVDAGRDAGSDAGTDAGVDAGRDAGFDAGRDAGFDAGRDAGVDAGRDAGRDAVADGAGDAATDGAASDACTGYEQGVAGCTNGRDDDCDGRTDCMDPDCRPFGPRNECCNGVDDNDDGIADELTCRCFSDLECAGVGDLDQVCWTETFSVCGPRCNFYGGSGFCRMFFGDRYPRCDSRTGQCVR
ncbi:MAG: hypothetical protein RMK74_11260 [Myxococcales bacterium]|nr:hypothetical protein [Myxococcales bacterium]